MDLYDDSTDQEKRQFPDPQVSEAMQNIAMTLQDGEDNRDGLQPQELAAIGAWLQNIVSLASANPSLPPEVLDGATEALQALEVMLPKQPRVQGETEQFAGKSLSLGDIVEKWEGPLGTVWGVPSRQDPGEVFAHLFHTGKR